MESSVYSIAKIFNDKLFIIPDYQRGYAWENVHCSELMEDIELLPAGKEHYTGTLVLHRQVDTADVQDINGTYYKTYDVVDGQQRLTTLTILLNTIYKAIDEVGDEDLARGIMSSYLYARKKSTRDPLYKLTLNRDSRAFFENNILNQHTDLQGVQILSHQRLADAQVFFTKYFANRRITLGEAYGAWLESVYDKVTQRLKLSVYEVNSAADVGVIFEVMNNRGKPLSELEKVKNYLLYLTSKLDLEDTSRNNLTARINAVWKIIFETLMAAGLTGESEDQLLRANWLMAYDYTKKNWKGSKSVKERFDLRTYQGNHSELYHHVGRYVDTLQNCALAFTDIDNPIRSTAFHSVTDIALRGRIRERSIKLKRLNTLASFRPLLIACRLRFNGGETRYELLANLLEKFAFRVYYRMEKQRADTGQPSLYKAAFDLFNNNKPFEEVLTQVKGTLAYYCDDTKFRKSLLLDDEETEDRYGWSALKYFLYEYEEHLASNQPVVLRWEEFSRKDLKDTIEHILPQTPRDEYWLNRFNRHQQRIYTHNLGNLCLTYNNRAYWNYGFDTKKGTTGSATKCYANSALFQERELVQVSEWTIVAIKERRKRLVDWALTRWHVDGLPTEVMEEPIEEEMEEVTE